MIKLKIDGQTIFVHEGSSVAAAIFAGKPKLFRTSFSGEQRFPLCGMGICFECRVSINGVKHRPSCQVLAKEGMKIETNG